MANGSTITTGGLLLKSQPPPDLVFWEEVE